MLVPAGWLSVRQAAEALGVSTSTVYRLVQQGVLEARVLRGRERGMLVSREAVEALGATALVAL